MIRGNLLDLRTIRKSDLPDFYNLNAELQERGDFNSLLLRSEEDFYADFSKTGYWSESSGWLAILGKDEEMLGAIGFSKPSYFGGTLTVHYHLFKREYWGKGYGTEALRMFTRYLFQVFPIHKLQLLIVDGNIPSAKIAEKCNYVREALLKEAYYHNFKHQDILVYRMTRNEFLDAQNMRIQQKT
jgi:ribosomal-protein-alanine N-acetyltransferase